MILRSNSDEFKRLFDGEVLSDLKTETPTIDKDYMKMLYTILDGKITIK